ncbi:12377_t:CDS:2 [Racocetra persica]|uniref:12377_t:CDS:1 n=1 Tax=Racocetra persica TaxID=160502 RepID=A0ACA9M802_9GLOM|nr:12377_t:CDS:2 [Racocetra persica]
MNQNNQTENCGFDNLNSNSQQSKQESSGLMKMERKVKNSSASGPVMDQVQKFYARQAKTESLNYDKNNSAATTNPVNQHNYLPDFKGALNNFYDERLKDLVENKSTEYKNLAGEFIQKSLNYQKAMLAIGSVLCGILVQQTIEALINTSLTLLPFNVRTQADEKTHYLLADILNRKLPLANCRDKKIFSPNNDADYRTLCTDYENDYGLDLPKVEKVSEEIAYEYLFLVVKSLIGELKNFASKTKTAPKSKKNKSTKLLKPRTPVSKEKTCAYYDCLIDLVSSPQNDRTKITELTHKCKCSKEKLAKVKAEIKHKLIHELAKNYKEFGENLGRYVKADIVGSFGVILALLAMFFGYNLKLGARTAKLEKKNGKEQKQIDDLKKEVEELRRGVKN